jgi:hypothetical protein
MATSTFSMKIYSKLWRAPAVFLRRLRGGETWRVRGSGERANEREERVLEGYLGL